MSFIFSFFHNHDVLSRKATGQFLFIKLTRDKCGASLVVRFPGKSGQILAAFFDRRCWLHLISTPPKAAGVGHHVVVPDRDFVDAQPLAQRLSMEVRMRPVNTS